LSNAEGIAVGKLFYQFWTSLSIPEILALKLGMGSKSSKI